jgi:hypothetical protein
MHEGNRDREIYYRTWNGGLVISMISSKAELHWCEIFLLDADALSLFAVA